MAKLTWKWRVKVTPLCPTLCDPVDCISPWNSPGQDTGGGNLSLLQGIFPTHGSNPGLLHCRKILYQLSYQGSSQKVEGKNQKGGPKRQKPAGMYGLAFCFCLLSFANHSYFTSPSAPFAGKECCRWRWLLWHRNNNIFSEYKIGCIFLHTASQLTCSQIL